MTMTELKGEALLYALSQAKLETSQGLCTRWANRLEQLGTHIRLNDLSATEAHELLTQEAEKLRHDNNEMNA